jgi:hypothetical protein
MGLKMDKRSRTKLLETLRKEYSQASAKRKKELLKTMLEATGYSKKHAIKLLNGADEPVQARRIRPSVYDDEVREALLLVWKASNMLCSKRLIPFMREFLTVLEATGHVALLPHVRQKLLAISAATMDRLLAPERQKLGKGFSLTRAGNFLKKQIPIRTFAEWTESCPGFFEADLVAHCGGSTKGQFVQTLTLTDIHTQWTECIALMRRGEIEVIEALEERLSDIPFPVKGLDTDNGGEFINYLMLDWCSVREITFTRSRQYKKNDQAHVEERNGSVVRRLVGYDRLEGIEAYSCLTALYSQARLFINFFQPSLKLIEKHRSGAKVYRRYDVAKTPFRRIIDSDCVSEEHKVLLRQTYESLDPVQLLTSIRELQQELRRLSAPKPQVIPKMRIVKQRKHLERIPRLEFKAGSSPEPRKLILSLAPGTIFKAVDLLPYCPKRGHIDHTLSQMTQKKEIERIGWGVYRTKQHEPTATDGTNLREAMVLV